MTEFLTHFCIKEPIEGEIKGTCCVCGKDTERGHKKPFSDNFSGYSYLVFGNCVCPYCYAFFKNQNLRRKSWVVTKEGIVFLKRLDCLQYLLNLPSPPFFFYITKSGQKQGWLSALKIINYSRERFCISTDWVGHFFVDRKQAELFYELIRVLREKGASKTAIRTGEWTIFAYRKAVEGGYEKMIIEAKKYVKEPLWEVICYVAE